MRINEIDSNFVQQRADDNTVWVDVKSSPFKIYGVFYDDINKEFTRVPHNIAKTINKGVEALAKNTAGGRVKFRTNSTSISLKTIFPNDGIMTHMPLTGSNGFSIYVNDKFYGKVSPEWDIFKTNDKKISFTAKVYLHSKGDINDIKIYFPLYGGVNELYIGLDNNCIIEQADSYKNDDLVVYYGSSITQGGCASHPGNEYQGHIERWLNVDYINLGFAGSGLGEIIMADYITSLNPTVVVMDYDYNAPDVEYLEKTHYPFYRRIRDTLPNTPIIFISKPDYRQNAKQNFSRREVVKKTYLESINEGDKLTAFIDGEILFGTEDYDACTVDGCHPNDLGFYRMAKNICPYIKEFIKK